MSHVAEVDLVITDLDALATAAAEVGLELVVGQRTYRWYGRFLNDWHNTERAAALKGHDPKQFGKCQHALRLKGDRTGYEIGLVPRRDGQPGWELLYDVYGPGRRLEEVAGEGLGQLRDWYAATVARKQLQKQGYRVFTQRNEANELQLVAQA